MTTIDTEFKWSRGFEYEIGIHEGMRVIRQSSRTRQTFEPLKVPTKLYLAFSELDGSPEAYVDFARKWGLLEKPADEGAWEFVHVWRSEIKKMKNLIGFVSMVKTEDGRRLRMEMASLKAFLVSGEPNTRPALVLQPPSLLEAMKLQLAQSHASGAALQRCSQPSCGKWFEVGAAGKRSVAKFCSDTCRNRYHYERRAIQ